MVLSGNSAQTNCSRSNSVVALSGKEQISPVLLLSDNAPENHNEMEQSCMASVIRTSLRSRKKPSLGVNVGDKQCDRNGFSGEKTFAEVKEFVNGKQMPSSVTNDASAYFSLVDFLSKTPRNSLPLDNNGISSLWTCNLCCSTFLSNAELQVHQASHKTKTVPVLGNNVKSVIRSNKKRQSPEEPISSKRMKRSSSPEQCFLFNADDMIRTVIITGEKFYKCDICEQSYAITDVTPFKIHYLRSHINYQFISSSDRALCSIIDDGLKSKVTDFLYRCYFCNISCAEKQVLIDHNAEHKSHVFRCEYCHAVFYQNKAFLNHMKNCTKSPPLTLCLHCKEPTWFEDRDIHTREYHCYSNGQIRKECVYGCAIKFKKLFEIYKHYAGVHKDVYFSCIICKIRFLSAEQLATHNKSEHNAEDSKKQLTAFTNKSDKVNHAPKKSKSVKPPRDVILDLKPSSQPVVKSNTEAVVKPNYQTIVKPTSPSIGKSISPSNKANSQSSASPSPQPSSSQSPQQRYFQDILFRSILKIDLIEQVNVLKKHAVLYPGMLSLPRHPVFASNAEDENCPCCPSHGEEEFLRPVFSSSQENKVYICKACGVQCTTLGDITSHMTSAHPYIHNDYFVFNREDLPEDFWNLSHLPQVKYKAPGRPSTTGRSSIKSTTQYKCSCCAFESKEIAEFHKHLLQCAKKQKYKTEVHTKAKQGNVKKEEVSGDNSRRRMAITGVVREVPDDILFSYKKKLEKTMRKPGDSETVFNMLNKLPSKRLVKTTERYDALYYKNNKAMKPKRSSMERMAQVLNDKDLSFSLSDYLKYFIHNETKEQLVDDVPETTPLLPEKLSNDINKVVVDKKPKVAKTIKNDEIHIIVSDKKSKVPKTSQAQNKYTKHIGDKKFKSPKLNGLEEMNKQPVDSKKLKVPKHNHADEKKIKSSKPNGAAAVALHTKSLAREVLKVEVETGKCLDKTEMSSPRGNMNSKSLQNVKVVEIHYPTTQTKCKTLKPNNKQLKSNKNILMEKRGKNLNVKKKGKLLLQDVKKKSTMNKSKSSKLNALMKISSQTIKANCDKPNVATGQRELSPRKKKTTRIVIVSDQPLLSLPIIKKKTKKHEQK